MRIKQEVWWIVEWNPTQNRVDIHREDDMRYVHFGEDCTNYPHRPLGSWQAWEMANVPVDIRDEAVRCWNANQPTDPVEMLKTGTCGNLAVIAAILKEREEHEEEVAGVRQALKYAVKKYTDMQEAKS